MNRRDVALLWIVRASILLGAFLLFLVQPMVAKRLLPSLGGTPAVWNTVMVFFQAALLIGYGYAHLISTRLPIRTGVMLHIVAMGIVVWLRIMPSPSDAPPPGFIPSTMWLLNTLAAGVGLPFVLVAATSPLLQFWFSQSNHPRRDDPYFLYAASNLGSFAALIAYPVIVERWLPLGEQITVWRFGLVIWFILMTLCGVLTISRIDRGLIHQRVIVDSSDVTWYRKLLWIACAAAASSWLLALTQYLTTDLAPVPLLWIIPLSIYLLSFMLAFASKPLVAAEFWTAAFPAVLVLLVSSLVFAGTWQRLGLHLVAFTIGCMVCHTRLAVTRPSADHLTEFYFLVSIGGVVGGVFNAILAPMVFPVIAEYGIAIALAGLVAPLPTQAHNRSNLHRPITWILLAITLAVLIALFRTVPFAGTPTIAYASLVVVPILVASWLFEMPRWVGVIAGGCLIFAQFQSPIAGRTLRLERSYFGVHRVMDAGSKRQHRLLHGQTVHGIQSLDDRDDPLAYYARSGPLGQIMHAFPSEKTQRVGVVGLGSGAIATYANDSAVPRNITFYEIDPMVVELASDPNSFTYLRDADIDASDIILGDGRESLTQSQQNFDMLVLDAFSSDAISMHLLTREAMVVYREHLSDGGLLVFHISNQHLDLTPVLAALAEDANWVAYHGHSETTIEQVERGITTADYVVMASSGASLQPLIQTFPTAAFANNTWRRIDHNPGKLWTDDFANLLDVLRWGY